ncbi:hypothetical protein C8A01DRAFT_39543 [Parachaetomium inaequale]|uniref:Uncharacterized protein n=1 Tax=Parachaetomium inaequale TaxID=2588326 RepID=A0AAN6P925_9PEZI|nr:hypothetical protein C8A01DRAFT_39543 [Parachaetomium inaequale]
MHALSSKDEDGAFNTVLRKSSFATEIKFKNLAGDSVDQRETIKQFDNWKAPWAMTGAVVAVVAAMVAAVVGAGPTV